MMNRYTDHDIHVLTERYFEGLTSLEEEAALRRMLAETRETSPDILEAKAVLGFFAMASAPVRRKKRIMPAVWRVASVAAMLAIVVSLGWMLHQSPGYERSNMLAYIGGVRTTDADVIEDIIFEDLSYVREAGDVVSEDIYSDFNIITEEFND